MVQLLLLALRRENGPLTLLIEIVDSVNGPFDRLLPLNGQLGVCLIYRCGSGVHMQDSFYVTYLFWQVLLYKSEFFFKMEIRVCWY